MHILFIADGDSKYGASTSLIQLVSELKKIDDSLKISVVITKNSTLENDFRRMNCNVYKIPYMPFCQGIPYAKWKLPVKYMICGIQYWYGRFFAVHVLEKKMNINTIDLIHSNSSREDFGAELSKKFEIPLIWHIRENEDISFKCFSFRKDSIQLMNQEATEIIAISQAVERHWIKRGIQAEKIVQIYNGVNENKVTKKKYPKKGEKIKLIMMGSLGDMKRQHHIITAITLLDEESREKFSLDIVGDGSREYTKKLKKLIKDNDLGNQIYLLGYQKGFYGKLAEYDCGILCSRNEGFGRATAEYMMAGLPVIASRSGANAELIENGVNGLLYQDDDMNDLKNKLLYLSDNSIEIEKMGKRARYIAKKRFTSAVNAQNIYHEYKKILER